MLTIENVCSTMLQQGFEYGCMAQDTSLAFLVPTHPSKMAGSILKPHAPALHCSRVNEEPVLDWHNFVNAYDFQISTYAARPLVFIKADMSRIADTTDHRFKAEWRRETEYMPLVNWTKVASTFSGIKVDLTTDPLFPMWDVDTLVVWDAACITDVRAFRNVGEWLYEGA